MDDKNAKELAAEKMKEFNRRFLELFPAMRCAEIKELPVALEKSRAAQRLHADKSCDVYVVAAVEIVEDMLTK